MKRTVLAFVAVGAVALAWGGMSLAWAEPPPIFADRTFPQARTETADGARLLVVKFTAEWCRPCKMMDRSTWRDEKVEGWMKQHGVAIAVDVDKHNDVARSERINAMPTTVAYRGGKEVSRVVGFRSAEQMVEWLESARKGEAPPEPDRGRRRAAGGDEAGAPGEVQGRMDRARDLLAAEKYDEALKEFQWLWANMAEVDPAMIGVRMSFVVGDMSELAKAHPPAKDAFIKDRDALEAKLEKPGRTFRQLQDWLALNRVVKQEERSLAWFDRIKADPESKTTLRRVGFMIRDVLEANKRWADMGALVGDPKRELRNMIQRRDMINQNVREQAAGVDDLPPELKDEMENVGDKSFAADAGRMYGTLLAAGRAAEAEGFAQSFREEAGEAPRALAAMVEWALKVGKPREDQRALLDAAEKQGQDVKALREQLEAALK